MTQKEMFEKSFERPSNFFKLSPQEQWDIDKELGILDWEGVISYDDYIAFSQHYQLN